MSPHTSGYQPTAIFNYQEFYSMLQSGKQGRGLDLQMGYRYLRLSKLFHNCPVWGFFHLPLKYVVVDIERETILDQTDHWSKQVWQFLCSLEQFRVSSVKLHYFTCANKNNAFLCRFGQLFTQVYAEQERTWINQHIKHNLS